jgi:hypothetical protein
VPEPSSIDENPPWWLGLAESLIKLTVPGWAVSNVLTRQSTKISRMSCYLDSDMV